MQLEVDRIGLRMSDKRREKEMMVRSKEMLKN